MKTSLCVFCISENTNIILSVSSLGFFVEIIYYKFSVLYCCGDCLLPLTWITCTPLNIMLLLFFCLRIMIYQITIIKPGMQNGQPSNSGNCLVCIFYPTVQAIDVIVTLWHHLTIMKSSLSVVKNILSLAVLTRTF